MRILLAAAAALLAIGTSSPASASLLAAGGPASVTAVHAAPDGVTTVLASKKKKKKKSKKKSGSGSASFVEIQSATRGKKDLEIKVKTSSTERYCELSVKWRDGSTTEDDSNVNDDKICEFSIEVPNSTRVVGSATATVTVRDLDGKKVASAKKTFSVK